MVKYSAGRCSLAAMVALVSIPLATPVALAQTPPEEFLGFKPGADFHLANYEQAMGYFDLLAGETDRMIMRDMGETSMGRRMRYAIISTKENLDNLDRYQEITRRLSLARGVNAEEAERLADEGRAIVWIDGGLHASEVAPAQHNLQLAYDMVTREDRQTRYIRENVILLLVFANPDGMSIVSNWYMKNVGTEYETSSVPELYHKYAGHDNNRDSMLANLPETRNMNRATSQEWFPEILYNQHQTAPFPARIFIPPEAESTNPNVHPLIIRWKNLIGSAMGKGFEEANQPGAISRINYDNWWPGYVTQIVESHNIPAILTETALYRYATPRFYANSDFPAAHQELVMGTFYPSPWRGGWWRLGDAVAYNLTASRSVMEVAAKYRFEFLRNKWKMANDVMERFASEPPYGWIISADQADQSTTALLIDRMMLLGAEVHTADETFVHAGIPYPAGSFILLTSQPFGLFVKNMLEIQEFPDLRDYPHLWQGLVGTFSMNDQSPLRPYDGVGWTLTAQMGVDSYEMIRPLNANVKISLLSEPPQAKGGYVGNGRGIAFSRSDNNSFKAVNRILAAGGRVTSAEEDFAINGQDMPKGSFVVEASSISTDALRSIATETGITMHAGDATVSGEGVRKPRLALYKSWVASMDAGWLTLIFENYGFDFHLLTNDEVRAGRLHDRFDVIVLADQGARSIINGHRKGTIHPDYVDGITKAGVDHLKEFVQEGGTLICNKNSGDLAINAFRLPIKNVLRGVSRNDFSIPGAIVRMNYDTSHPLAYGMKERSVAYFSGGARAYEIVTEEPEAKEEEDEPEEQQAAQQARGRRGRGRGRGGRGGQQAQADPKYNLELKPQIAATYPDESLLLSGWQIGEDKLYGKAAVIEVEVGEGRVVLFAFNVHNRSQTYATFKLLFNAIYR